MTEKTRLDALIEQVDTQLATILAESDPTLSYTVGGRSLQKAAAVRELMQTRRELVDMRNQVDTDEVITYADLDGEAAEAEE